MGAASSAPPRPNAAASTPILARPISERNRARPAPPQPDSDLLRWLRDPARSATPKNEWGRRVWDHIHCRSIAWVDRPAGGAILAEQRYLQALFDRLPCEECRQHATQHYWAHIPDLSTSLSYQTWAYNFHNAVNRRLGKPIFSQKEYDETYLEQRLAAHQC